MFPVEIWGTVGQWVGSVLTGGSLLLGYRILGINQEDKRRAQASLVTFTQTRTHDPDTEYANGVRGNVYNGSELPITYARIVVRSDKISPSNAAHSPDPTVISIAEVSSEDESITVEPKQTAFYSASIDPILRLQTTDIKVQLAFTDGSGRNWTRDADGMLSEVVKGLRIVRRPKRRADKLVKSRRKPARRC